jgi:DNA-binding protein HU-beta
MASVRPMGKSELISHLADRFQMRHRRMREFLDERRALSEHELRRAGEFVLPGMVRFVFHTRRARVGRNLRTGDPIQIPQKTIVKARMVKRLKDSVLAERQP